MDGHTMKFIARVRSDFPSKFGIPRQSGLVPELEAIVIFEPEFRNPDALRGVEEYSHLWLLWFFSESVQDAWSPTVRPPRLGGNVRKGVFATRSPFRPNPIGLSSVRLLGVEEHPLHGTILRISGADIMDNTPVFDIKPYIRYGDCHPDAVSGFARTGKPEVLIVEIPDELARRMPEERRAALEGVLAQNPRPRFHEDNERVYKMDFAGFCIEFSVNGETLSVLDIRPL